MNTSKENKSYPVQQGIKPWLCCFIATLFFFYEFIQMNMFNALSPSLIKSFSLTASELGNLSACYFYAMLITLFPAGLLLDHINTKKIILTTMSISVIGTISLSLSNSFTTAFLSRFLSGLGGAFAFQSALRIAADNIHSSKLASANGLIITFGMLGGIVAQTPMTLLTQLFNWHQVLWIYASMGITFLIIISMGLRNKTASIKILANPCSLNLRSKKNGGNDNEKKYILLDRIKLTSCNHQTWLAGLYTALFNLPVPLLGAAWGSLYLMQIHHLTSIEASTVVSLLFFGIIAGCPLFGWCSDIIQKRRLPMLLGGLFTLSTILAIIYVPSLSKVTLMALFFLLGLFSSTQTIGYSVIVENNPQACSTALGIAALLIMGIGAIVQTLFGWIMDAYWQGTFVNQIRVYTIDSFNTAILILPISFMIGLIISIFLKETFNHKKTN